MQILPMVPMKHIIRQTAPPPPRISSKCLIQLIFLRDGAMYLDHPHSFPASRMQHFHSANNFISFKRPIIPFCQIFLCFCFAASFEFYPNPPKQHTTIGDINA
ncbi:hypothetical protein PGTUg99_002098 [Puccinia graminis f. sp. tritici]|uniref:Uncharacterized protein n=1 Tax=Puccinia graminis f. sp. tritici TaxID=56615 RepID=A0A5B0RVP7_PUCGR|nr:hypothetical protein PGTUg99_002098 [Puccinia graminis f. sp. tritici]